MLLWFEVEVRIWWAGGWVVSREGVGVRGFICLWVE